MYSTKPLIECMLWFLHIGLLFQPWVLSFLEGLTFGPNGTLFVASFLNDKVVKYTKQGRFLGVVSDIASCNLFVFLSLVLMCRIVYVS